ncbi:MAG: hypothetical protein ACREXR_07425, partial [Gammaproteobacteria bacterium]
SEQCRDIGGCVMVKPVLAKEGSVTDSGAVPVLDDIVDDDRIRAMRMSFFRLADILAPYIRQPKTNR